MISKLVDTTLTRYEQLYMSDKTSIDTKADFPKNATNNDGNSHKN